MAGPKKKIPRFVVPLGIALIAVASAACGYLFVIAPKLSYILPGGRYDLSGLRSEVTDDQAYAKSLDSTLAAYQNINSQLSQKAGQIVPLGVDRPGLMTTLDAIVRSHSMVLKSLDISPMDDQPGAAGQETARLNLNVTGGTYQEFKLLLADIERSARLFDVHSVVFAPANATYSMQVDAYYLPETDVKAAPSAADATPPPQPTL